MGSELDYRGWPFNYLSTGSNNWALNLITEPAVEPVSVVEAKAHLRVDFADDDAYIGALIVAARVITEERTNRAFITQTWEYALDNFPNSNVIKLRKPKLQSVVSIKYKDVNNVEYTIDPAQYIVDTDSIPGRIILNWGKYWPVILLQPGSAVRIRYIAGYGDDGTKVPQSLKQAMLFLISNWYEQREPVVLTRSQLLPVPMTFDFLVGPYRVVRFP